VSGVLVSAVRASALALGTVSVTVESSVPTADQKVLLQAIYGVFVPDGSWPVYQHLDSVLDQDHDLAIDDVLADMPRGLLRVYDPVRPDSTVALRVAGLLHCDDAEEAIDLFLLALKWCVAKERSFRPASPTACEQFTLTSADAARDWANDGLNVTEVALAKAYALLGTEWMYASLGGSPTEWSLGVPPDIRRFRGVESIDDYLRIVSEEPAPQAPANPLVSTPAAAALIGPFSSTDPVALPVLDLGGLHPLVRDACQPLFGTAHYREGVLKATLALRDLVRAMSGLTEPDDSTLMGKALGGKNPRIVVADLTSETGQNIQRGTVHLAQGIIARLRNPLTHENVELAPQEALEMAVLISQVVRDVEGGTKSAVDASPVAFRTPQA
jgi:uncharacterized protein (TIGR02391 family)